MNTIRRSRKRPRVRSVNFRTLYWLVRRVAAWEILSGGRPLSAAPTGLVRWFLDRESSRLEATAKWYRRARRGRGWSDWLCG